MRSAGCQAYVREDNRQGAAGARGLERLSRKETRKLSLSVAASSTLGSCAPALVRLLALILRCVPRHAAPVEAAVLWPAFWWLLVGPTRALFFPAPCAGTSRRSPARTGGQTAAAASPPRARPACTAGQPARAASQKRSAKKSQLTPRAAFSLSPCTGRWECPPPRKRMIARACVASSTDEWHP